MSTKSYPLTPARVGNQRGFRLPAAFYKDNPHLSDAAGYIEVLSEDTLLIKLEPCQVDEEEESLIMAAFLDLLMEDTVEHPSELVPYTEDMKAEIDDLLADVALDYETPCL